MKSNRRKFLKKIGGAVLSTPLILNGVGEVFKNAYGDNLNIEKFKGKVILSKGKTYSRNRKEVDKLLGKGMKALLDSDSEKESWKLLFKPTDVVSIKVNTLGGRMLSPSYELIKAVVSGLKSAGVRAENIIVWDRSSRELRRAGYPINTSRAGVKIFGTNSLQQGYEPHISYAISVGSCFSKILTRYCNALINIGVMKDHDLAGISVTLKNFYGAIQNPNKYHDNHCCPYVAHLNTSPYIRKKLRLNIVDAPTSQYEGGPGYNSRYHWPFNGILISFDSVATDRIVLDFIEKERALNKFKSLKEEKRFPEYIMVAGKIGLGEATLSSIKTIKV